MVPSQNCRYLCLIFKKKMQFYLKAKRHKKNLSPTHRININNDVLKRGMCSEHAEQIFLIKKSIDEVWVVV